ncbi:DUF1127 domain-containing protein [Inquilinus limosus]|uniref:DUF1127 domain-containing protein n=1 Tax=Inquilinus limosus TaxID=171674 RepID=UPI003F190809
MLPRAPGSREAPWAWLRPPLGRLRRLAFRPGRRSPLHQLSDHLLRDIGLSRADVDRAPGRRFRPD